MSTLVRSRPSKYKRMASNLRQEPAQSKSKSSLARRHGDTEKTQNCRSFSTIRINPAHSALPAPRMEKGLALSSKCSRGFTLIELLITVVILGILGIIWAGSMGGALTAYNTAQDADQESINHRLGSVLLDYAATISKTGDLPEPSTNGSVRFAITDGTIAPLEAMLVQARIRPALARGDGSAADNVRVFDTVTGQSLAVPLYNTFGPMVTLTYTEAVIYSTHCMRTETCNTTGTGGVPGSTGHLTSTNLSTFALGGDDFGLERISTLAVQKQKLQQTADNIDAIRTRMQELFRERQRTANANDTTNFYPRCVVACPTAALSTTSDCHNDGWYRLDIGDILSQIGLINTVNGLNAWGGQIHYCPDYDPTGAAGNDAPPHFAALRILTSPSAGGHPTNATTNTIIPF